jgi:flagellar basal-body rod modification protein FlgD
MTAPVTSTTPPASGTTTSGAATGDNPGAILGQDDFLQLLVAQLKNQDPMDPMDGTQFAAQLAQFSTVQQLIDMNTKMDTQNTAATQSQLAQQASFASSIIGRDVILTGANVNVVDGTTPRVNIDLSGAAKTVHVDVIGADGSTVVGSEDFNNVATGNQTLALTGAGLATGSYTYKVTAVDASGKAVTATGNTIGRVDSTVFQAGQVMLRIDGTVVPLTDITEIVPAAAATDAATTTN